MYCIAKVTELGLVTDFYFSCFLFCSRFVLLCILFCSDAINCFIVLYSAGVNTSRVFYCITMYTEPLKILDVCFIV